MAGYKRDTTPNLQRIADDANGQSFSKCFSAGIATPYSSGSILTGTYPLQHGLKVTNEVIPNQLTTAPELFREEGYRTAGLSRNSYLSSGTGLDRGFDRFSWLSSSTIRDVVDVKTLLKYAINIRSHSAGFTTNTAKHATPYLMNELAKEWLDDLRNEQPFFYYLHYNEPHRPYYPPLSYLERYTDDISMSAKEAAETAMHVHEDLYEIVANGYTLTDEEEAAMVAMYDAEIAYTDEMIGQLFDHIQSMDLDDTVVIVSADHGELLGEHSLLAHQVVLEDSLIHVPMVVHGFDEIAHQGDELVQHHDVMETLIAEASADASQYQGVDLRDETREYAIAQRGPEKFEKYLTHNPDFDTSRFHKAALTAFRDHEFKYQQSDEGGELFALPDETTDVSDNYPEVVDRMQDELESWLDTHGQSIESRAESELTESMQKQLRDLGYLA